VVSARGSDISQFFQFPLVRGLLGYTLKNSSKVIGVCQALKDAMVRLKIPPEKIAVIPNGVDHKKFFPIPRDQARKQLGLPLEKRIILSVGGLIPRKGFDILIKSLKLLIQELPLHDVALVIIGEGPERDNLAKLTHSEGLDKNVSLVGAIPHKDLRVWYSAADLFCLASDREGWPNVVLESMACGTPVVATNVWGIPEIIQSEDVGLLTIREERVMAKQIRAALTRVWEADKIVAYSRQHTWQRTAASVVSTLATISGEAPYRKAAH